MTLQDYLRVLREQWLVVVGAVLVAVIAAVGVSLLRPPAYTSGLTLYVSAQSGDGVSSAYEGAQLSKQRVTSYVDLVGSTRVAREVTQRLNLSTSPQQLSERIDASSAPDSVLIDVAVRAETPQQARRLANAVGAVFIAVVADLERPVAQDAVPPVAVRLVQPATVPTEQSSMGILTFVALGLLAGLALGAAAALARNALDNGVKSEEQLRELTTSPVLATIPLDRAAPRRPLTLHEVGESVRAETFRQLRTNLGFVNVDRPPKVVTVTSSLTSEGKTTTVCNLAIALGAAGVRTLIVDADLRRPGVADLLGLEGSMGLTNVLTGRAFTVQAIQQWKAGRFDVLASGPLPPNPSELLSSRHMHDLLRSTLRSRYDVILVDTPPLLPAVDAAVVAPASDGALLVCRFKRTSSKHVAKTVQELGAVECPLLGTVFTMVPGSGRTKYSPYTSYRTEDNISGVLPLDGAYPAGHLTDKQNNDTRPDWVSHNGMPSTFDPSAH